MSKVDAQRAIREARYARFAAGRSTDEARATSRRATAVDAVVVEPGGGPPPTAELFAAPEVTTVTAKPSAKPKVKAGKPPAEAAPSLLEPEVAPPAEAGVALCGHRSISGRTCTREKDHPQKNHRYS